MKSETTRQIAALILGLLLAALTYAATAQNIIQNGDFGRDSNDDGLADLWYVGPFVNKTDLMDGVQYAAASNASGCNQVFIGQVLQLAGGIIGNTYTLDFDLSSNRQVNVTCWIAYNAGYNLLSVQPAEFQHYSVTFVMTWDSIYRVSFHTATTQPGWIRLDNVVLCKQTAVGCPEITPEQDERREVFDMLGRQLSREPEHGFYLVRQGRKVTKYYKP